MNEKFLIELMRLAKEGYKSKKLNNYNEIYQAIAGVWIKLWEVQYHTSTEKTEMYEKLKKMEV